MSPKDTPGRPAADSAPTSAQSKRVRASREATTQQILDAAEALFAKRNPSDVTVREIAEAAGVTHALVHQYVGTKEQLLDAVVRRAAPNRQQMIRDVLDFDEVLPLLFKDVLARPLHSRTMIRSVMDGVEYLSLQERIETGRMLVDLARASVDEGPRAPHRCGGADPRVVGAAVTALAFGWVAVGEWLLPIYDLEDLDYDDVIEQLTRIAQCIGDAIYPDEQGEATAPQT